MLLKLGKLIGLLVMAGAVWAGVARADEDAEMIQAHPVAIYPNAVRQFDSNRSVLLTKDDVGMVHKFYEKNRQPADRLEPLAEKDQKGFRLRYHAVLSGRAQSVLEVEFGERPAPESGLLHEALGELLGQVQVGNHTEAEYRPLEAKYARLNRAYFRMVDGDGRRQDEGEVIYRRAYQTAHQDMLGGTTAAEEQEIAAGKEKAKDIKKKMKALKAKGDYAAMMQMAMGSAKDLPMPAAGRRAMAARQKDTWDLWVKCLQDLDAAAYWTRLQYNAQALPTEK